MPPSPLSPTGRRPFFPRISRSCSTNSASCPARAARWKGSGARSTSWMAASRGSPRRDSSWRGAWVPSRRPPAARFATRHARRACARVSPRRSEGTPRARRGSRTRSSTSLWRRRAGRSRLFPEDLDEDALVAAAVPLAVEDPLPRAEVEPPLRDGGDDFAAHELPLDVRVGIVLAGVVVAPLRDRVVGDERLEETLVIAVKAGLVVVDEDRGRDVHRVDEAESFPNPALVDRGLDFAGDVHESDSAGEMKRQNLAMRFHGRASSAGAPSSAFSPASAAFLSSLAGISFFRTSSYCRLASESRPSAL